MNKPRQEQSAMRCHIYAYGLWMACIMVMQGCADAEPPPLHGAMQPRMNEAEVIVIAEAEMLRHFTDTFQTYRPYHAKYDNGVWHVTGMLPPGVVGGTPEVEIRDHDGKVIRVYHTQ